MSLQVGKPRELKPIGPVASAYVASRAVVKGIMGPVGSGKTIASIQAFMELARRQNYVLDHNGVKIRKSRFAIIRDTYPNLDRNTIPSFHKIVPRHVGNFINSSPRIHKFGFALQRDGHIADTAAPILDFCQVEVEFRAIGDQTVQDALRGLEVTAALVNEADRTHPDILTYLIGRIGRFGDDFDPGLVVDPQILLDLNGTDDENWTYKVLIEENLGLDPALADLAGDRPLVEYFEQPEAVDEFGNPNPRAENVDNLPKNYYAQQYAFAKRRGNLTYINRMLRSKYTPVSEGRTVFPEYIDEIHSAIFEAIPGIPLIVMADQGLLGAVLIGQVVKGQLRILEEIACVFETEDDQIEVVQLGGETLGRQVRDLLALKFPGFELADAICDPAGAAGEDAINYKSWRQDFQKGLGFKVRKARVPRNALEPRLKAVRGYLNRVIGAERALLVHKRCTMTRRAFRTKYYYQRIGKGAGDGYYSDVPKKVLGYADLMDALQYGCFELDKGIDLTPTGQANIGYNGGPAIQNESDFDEFSGV
ncbi:hypothetical protein HT136_01375 [Novosphingobium profundi]|uniref:hypothetical protein n=1 Tax=Novosphingobium profundi TaxID=1774954 RepID=UPI001BD9C476|nr:hypothetical protein [Novosphingobium profundi]MBT0667017.1 hypothetical protein [Novosphingobium profundi]